MRRLGSIPLRISIPALLLGCAAAISLIAWLLDLRLIEQEIENQSIEAAKVRITRLQSTLEYLLRQRDFNGIRMEVSGLATHTDVIAVYVIDEQDRVFAATQYATITRSATAIAPVLPEDLRDGHAARMAEVRSTMIGSVMLSADRRTAVSYYPLLVNIDAHTLRPVRRGLVIVLADIQAAKSKAFEAAGRQALAYVLIFSALAGGTWLFIHLSLTRRVARLVAATRQLASGNLDARADIDGNDELALVARAFDSMAARIAEDIHGRERAEQELRRTVSLLQATIESTADGLLIVDHAGRIRSFNERFASLWRVPAAILETRDDEVLLAHVLDQLKAPDAFLHKVRALYADREKESFDVLEFKDGRIFERYSCPQRLDGVAVGRVWSFRDVTAREHSEAAMERLNKDLLDASRQAGMAEVASNVLHNVGNVLNSVNVSASLVIESMQQSNAAGLARVVNLLREHEHDLASFITNDARGKHLLAYLERFSEHLLAKETTSLKELHALRSNIEHIKEIVTMQQRYATTSGMTQIIDLVDLVEDSLRMNADSLSRDGVEIVRKFEDVPSINVDKHRVLQILVNLVRNAIHACRESQRPDKRLTLHVARVRDRLSISVSDNGVGIAPENLTRIFSHGFTTRKDGHGFGLHGGALMARELGGTLTVHSDGINKGATFTLGLPVNVPELADA